MKNHANTRPRAEKQVPRSRKKLWGSLTAVGVILATFPALASSYAADNVGSTAVAAPIRAAFYYPWFPETEHWATQYHPSLGKYDSSDPAVLTTHMKQAKYAGLDAFIASYWGMGSKTAGRLPLVLDAARAQSFHIAPYYEPESLDTPPSATALRADFDSLAALSSDAAWLKVDGKPVLFVYNTGVEGSCAGIKRIATAAAGRFYINAKVFSGFRTCTIQPESWHQYGPAAGYDQQDDFAATVSAGFNKFSESSARLPRDMTRFKSDLARQVSSGARWHLTTTFNEWGEGSSVEPATEWPSASGMGTYLDAMRVAYAAGATTPPPTTEPTVAPTTPPATPAPVVAAAGDIACKPGYSVGSSCQHKAVSDKILADTAVGTVLALGDNQYEDGTLSAYQQSYGPTWGRLKSKTRPVPGNHEYHTSGASGYYDYFGSRAGDRTKGYYSFNVGAWHFVALNSERDTGTTGSQLTWLRADLKANPNKCVAAYFHKPRWSTGSGHGDNTVVAPFVKALYDANADLMLSGHDHDYERFYPLNPSGVRDDARGITQIVSGLGGKNHYSVAGRSTTVTKNHTAYGYSRLVLHAGSADISFVPAVGTYRDSYRLTCH